MKLEVCTHRLLQGCKLLVFADSDPRTGKKLQKSPMASGYKLNKNKRL